MLGFAQLSDFGGAISSEVSGGCMSESVDAEKLVADAISGDRIALQQLLLQHTSEVTRYVADRLPVSVQGVLDADDIVQQTFIEVFRSIRRFEPQSDGAFAGWLKAIALHRLQDAVKAFNRKKRGGDFRRLKQPDEAQSQSLVGLVELLSTGSHTPSKSVARHDAVQAVQQAIDDLPDDHRQAVQLRLIDGQSLEDVAAVIGRSPRAVQGLIDRAKKKLRAALDRLSLYE